MKISGKTILLTGGSEGIGFELALLLKDENTVIICGRNADKLAQAKKTLPGIVTISADLSVAAQRKTLVDRVLSDFPQTSVLINNAGGRQVIDPQKRCGVEDALYADFELNVLAPVLLCENFLPHFRSQDAATIVNITTGLIFLPKASYPFYCAAKAALHSYTQSLRWSLRATPIRVHEVILPLVNTPFHKGQLPGTVRAMDAAQAASLCLKELTRGTEEISIGKARLARQLAFLFPRKGISLINRI
ncbi:SDR family NAD(P)-dependent oxidoreductase [Desulfurispirillum indicum]|uniref:SDR family oxidoreductase n=1 Tax=Desulfurispirillum indicum TaxID=936456 RepID=UPI001CFA2CE0|nr:SDR family NAD(P)-dependent oxidoreductase [Desulfurispirillum indicum]UCZ56048.1 SDR family NAD(P)-dependent oxidoreductase [Desulfurispirillum indicum]